MEEERYVLIEQYLAGEMSAQEREAFEDRMKTESDLAEKVKLYQSLSENLRSKFTREDGEKILRANLSAIADEQLPSANATKIISLKWYYYAAAASVLIACLVWIYNSPSGAPQYSVYAMHEPLLLAERGSDSLKQQAEQAFNSKKYEQALLQLETLEQTENNNTEIQLYKGIALLELARIAEAETIFSDISNSNTVYENKAMWYLALSALKRKDYQRCKSLLKKLPEDSEEYTKAQEILKDL